jgi:hypothetical protein
LECEEGSYFQKNITIPQEALALYINPNPRSFEKAIKRWYLMISETINKPYTGYDPQPILISEIQKAKNRKIYIDVDFDDVSIDFIKPQLIDIINMDCITFIQTRGGFHMLIELSKLSKQYSNTWYKNLTKIHGFDTTRDNMIPVPGCTQGMFEPKLLTFNY